MYYLVSLVYDNLSSRPQHYSTDAEVINCVTVKHFEKWDITFDTPCRLLKGKAKKLWIVPRKILAGRFHHYPRYVNGYKKFYLVKSKK